MRRLLRTSTSDLYAAGAIRRAAAFTGACVLLTIVVAFLAPVPLGYLLPCLFVEMVILINTYPSVRLFATITPPEDRVQGWVDAVVAVFYILMMLSLGRPVLFALATAAMFTLALLKYVLLLGQVPYLRLLRHKMLVEFLGIFGGIAAAAGCLWWRADASLWLWALGFGLAQIDIFFLHPLYRLSPDANEGC